MKMKWLWMAAAAGAVAAVQAADDLTFMAFDTTYRNNAKIEECHAYAN